MNPNAQRKRNDCDRMNRILGELPQTKFGGKLRFKVRFKWRNGDIKSRVVSADSLDAAINEITMENGYDTRIVEASEIA